VNTGVVIAVVTVMLLRDLGPYRIIFMAMYVRFQVLKADSMNMTDLCDIRDIWDVFGYLGYHRHGVDEGNTYL
jgi:hypothetical protein